MKFRGLLFLLLAALMVSVVSDASAHDGRGRVGVYIGGPVWGPWYPPYYYYPPQQVIVVPPPQPSVYIEQSQEQPGPDAGQRYWYFCKSAQGYYPYVKECPGGWQKVLPQPEK